MIPQAREQMTDGVWGVQAESTSQLGPAVCCRGKSPDDRELVPTGRVVAKKRQFGLCFGYRVERLWTFTAVVGRGRVDENSNMNAVLQYSRTP